MFSLVVHGDAVGVDNVTSGLQGWLGDMGLIEAGHQSQVGRYIGYMESYAASHEALDKDQSVRTKPPTRLARWCTPSRWSGATR